MPRTATALLCCLAAVAATAAPAPTPRPWVTGWGRPVDPKGDCKFDRKGDRLTITVPGEGHELDYWGGDLNAPRLMRPVEGDFVFEVRVGGDLPAAGVRGRRAGILMLSGRDGALLGLGFTDKLGRGNYRLDGCLYRASKGTGQSAEGDKHFPAGRAYLRLERRGEALVMKVRADGERWQTLWRGGWPSWLPRRVKVGVFAESVAPGKFQVQFDHFSLTRPKK